jgi:hypothetical protein
MSRPAPIVLLTDFGTKDIYVASMKGVIVNLFPQATIIDLTHEIEPQNVLEAAFLLASAYPYFPQRSLFVSVVDPGVGSERRILAARTRRGIFLAPDNGLLTGVLEKEIGYELRSVTNRNLFLPAVSATFHGRDCFAPTAARLARQPSLFSKLGPRIRTFRRVRFPEPRVTGGKVRGEILFFDYFGNAFTNIRKELLGPEKESAVCVVSVGKKMIGPVRRSYYEAPERKPVAVFSSSNLLEIAVNKGSARDQLKLRKGIGVEVRKKR